MHRVTRSIAPATFDVAVDGPDVSGLIPPGSDAGMTGAAAQGRRRWPRTSGLPDRASLWWDSWVPVATTGWGALVLIAPLFVLTNMLGWASGGRRQGGEPG